MKRTGIIIQNEKSKSYTAIIKEYPGIMAQADDIESVKAKLEKAFSNFMEYIRKKGTKIDFQEDGI